MIPYEKYCADLKRLGGEVIYTEAEYNRKYGEAKEFEPLIITPRNQKRPMGATLENNKKKEVKPKKPKAVKPPKIKKEKMPKEPKPRYRPPKLYTEEEIKERRAEARRKKRAEFVAQGLTIRGTPRVVREKKVLTPGEIRERRLRYTRTWQTRHREEHLAYRREYRKRKLIESGLKT